MSRIPDEWSNPYQAPELNLEPEYDNGRPRSGYFWVRLAMGLQALTVVIGLALSVWNVETIVGSGPTLSAIGIFLAVVSFRAGLMSGLWTGASGLVFSLIVFLTILLLGWSPGDARVPVPVMGLAYCAVSGVLAVITLMQIRVRERAFHPLR